MINRIDTQASEENNKKTLSVAGLELSTVLDTDEPYDIALKKIDILRKHCLQSLGVTEKNILLYINYNRAMNHYLRNGASYFLGRTPKNSSKEELIESEEDYALFVSVISRIDKLTKIQKDLFLQNIKIHHETPQKMTDKTENVIIVMDRILSLIEKSKDKNN